MSNSTETPGQSEAAVRVCAARCVPMFCLALVVEVVWLLFLFWMTLR
jgi:hypothetical protein